MVSIEQPFMISSKIIQDAHIEIDLNEENVRY